MNFSRDHKKGNMNLAQDHTNEIMNLYMTLMIENMSFAQAHNN